VREETQWVQGVVFGECRCIIVFTTRVVQERHLLHLPSSKELAGVGAWFVSAAGQHCQEQGHSRCMGARGSVSHNCLSQPVCCESCERLGLHALALRSASCPACKLRCRPVSRVACVAKQVRGWGLVCFLVLGHGGQGFAAAYILHVVHAMAQIHMLCLVIKPDGIAIDQATACFWIMLHRGCWWRGTFHRS